MLSLTVNLKNILGILFTSFFLHNFANYEKRIQKCAFIVSIILLLGSGTLFPFILNENDAGAICDLLTILSFCLIPYFILKPKKWYVFALFGLIVNSAFDFFVETINYFFNTDSRIVTNLIFSATLIIFFVATFIIHKKTQSDVTVDIFERIPAILWFIIFLLSLSSYYMMMLSEDPDFAQSTSVILRIISSVFIIICIIYMMLKYTATIRTENQLQFQVATQIEQYKMLQKSNNDIRSFRHDYINNMVALSALLDAGKIEEAKQFIEQLNKSVVKPNTMFSTGNYLADAIISYKASEIIDDGIEITFDGSIPAEVISNNDISVILSNLLDNSIRGCKGCEHCQIRIKSIESYDGVLISISNSVKENVDISKKLKTTKQDHENHGLGIKNIKRILKKYHGFISFDCTDNVFTAKVGIMK